MAEFTVGLEARQERQVRQILATGEEELVKDPTPNERLQTLLREIQRGKESIAAATGPPTVEQAPWPLFSVHERLRAAYSEVEVMLDVLQHVRKPDDILVPLPMEAVRPSPARFLYEVQLQQAIQKETVEMVSNILLDAASDLDQSLKAAQHLDSESLRLRRRWILANKPGGLTAVDYRYPNVDAHFFSDSSTADLVRETIRPSAAVASSASSDAMDVDGAAAEPSPSLRLVIPSAHTSQKLLCVSVQTSGDIAEESCSLPLQAGVSHDLTRQLLEAQSCVFEGELLSVLQAELRVSKAYGVVHQLEHSVSVQLDDAHRLQFRLTDRASATAQTQQRSGPSGLMCAAAGLLLRRLLLDAFWRHTQMEPAQFQFGDSHLQAIVPEVHTLMRQYIAWKSFVRTVDALAQRRPELGVAVSVQTMANPSLLVAVVSIADKEVFFDIRSGTLYMQLPSMKRMRVGSEENLIWELENIAQPAY